MGIFKIILCILFLDKLNGDFNVGQIVKVKLGLSGYRAEIKKIDGNLITVMNIDLGFCEKVQSDCIYELADDIKKVNKINMFMSQSERKMMLY